MAATVVVGIALAASVAALVVLLRSSLTDTIDAAAIARGHEVAQSVALGAAPSGLDVKAEEDDVNLVQIVDAGGRVTASSTALAGKPPIARFRAVVGSTKGRTVPIDRPGRPGELFRVVAVAQTTPSEPVTVYVAHSLQSVSEATTQVTHIAFLGLPLLLLVVAVTTWVLTGRALQPVESIRAEVADITAHALDRRVPEPEADDEIARLARTMNEMLDRLQVSADRQQEFVADASHELQSPLASSRAQLEVGLAHAADTDWPTTAAEVLEENQRMERLVRDLLLLARTGPDSPHGGAGPVDLDDLVLEEVRRLRERGRVTADIAGVSPARVTGHPEQLRRVVRNLLDNAERHADHAVLVELRNGAGRTELVVTDDGPGIAAADRERIFERFTRLDAGRARDDGGSGLGLAIAKQVVEAHGGTIRAEPARQGARLVVTLPAAT